MHTKILFTALLTIVVLSAQAQKVVDVVDVKPQTTVRTAASLASEAVSTDTEYLFAKALKEKIYPLPFAQPVLEKSNGWLRLPVGWVRQQDVTKAGGTPIAAEQYDRIFQGTFGTVMYNDDEMSVDYGVLLLPADAGSLVVFIHFPDMQLLATAKMNGNVVITDRGMLIKFAEYEADRQDLGFELYRERDGIKQYNLYYGERLNTRHMRKFMDEVMTIETLDMKKMTAADWQVMRNALAEYGEPMSIYISAATLGQLKLIDRQ